MLFVRVMMIAELVEEDIGLRESGDLLGRKESGESFLPEIVSTFYFAFGLWGGSKAQGNLVEAQGGAELRKGVGLTGKEEGVVIDVQGQRQAAGDKGAGEEVEMRKENLARVDPRKGQQPAVIVDDFQEWKLLLTRREPPMGRGIVLPKLADLLDLPTADWLALPFVFCVWSEALSHGQTAHRGAV
jgi:hypothetical protein